ncbi:MAG: sugar phosphate isomerase/epimerase family protein [Planctomycetota bacterium]
MNALSVNQLSTLRWTLEEDVVAYREHGFDGIGIYRPKLDEAGIDKAVELLAENEMHVTSLSWAGGFTGSEGIDLELSISDAIAAVRDAATLRASTLLVLAGGRNNHIHSHVRNTLCKSLQEVASAAENYGVNLALEPIHPGCGKEWSFVNDMQAAMEVIEKVDSPNLGLTLDTYHIGMDENWLRWLPEVLPYVRLVQFGDGRHTPLGEMNRCLLGEGCIDLQSFYQKLHELGFDGPIEVELIGEDLEELSYESILKTSHEFFGEMKLSLVN